MTTPFIKGIQCSAMLDNHMRCIREAIVRQEADTEAKNALCYVCYRLQGSPRDYTIDVNTGEKYEQENEVKAQSGIGNGESN